MAYHAGYWSRWAPSRTRKRKGSSAVVTVNGAEADNSGAGSSGIVACSPEVQEEREDGGGYGRRVRGKMRGRGEGGAGRKRGRPPSVATDAPQNKVQVRKTLVRKLLWTDVGREEYNRTVACGSVSISRGECGAGQRFERGEGGGVT